MMHGRDSPVEKNLMRIVLGGRIPGYLQYKDSMSAREYVERVINKSLIDPVLTTQLSNGFVLVRLLKSYWFRIRSRRGMQRCWNGPISTINPTSSAPMCRPRRCVSVPSSIR